MELTEQQIEDNILKAIQIQTLAIQKKRSFCRFYLRGLCIFQPENCHFSHGVHDLDYQPWNQNQIVEYDYLIENDFNQKKTMKGPRVYKNLYEFQKEKIFTLQQLGQDREKRVLIRKALHQQQFQNFMKLLQARYPGANFTQEFLIREYTRAGFNKLMSRIKFSHLTTYLCNNPGNQYFQLTTIMPPLVKQERFFLIKKTKDEQIDSFYKEAYNNILKQHGEETIDEGKIKRFMFNYTKSIINIPPLNLYLKDKKCSFGIYLRSLLGENIADLQIKFEADLPTLIESGKKFLEKELPQRFIEWNEVYQYLAKEHLLNNGNIINQIKPFLALNGYKFLFFPMTQFIVHPQIESKIDYYQLSQCPCNFKSTFSQQELSLLSECIHNEKLFNLQQKESYDVYDLESLMQCAPSINNSKILSVDIEGRLRKGGYIEMIQLNNGVNTFLIDIYRMDLNGDVTTFELTKKMLRNVMVNKDILKIFHDCRHDSLVLHEFMQCCVINVYDTSATQTYIQQLESYKKLDEIISEKLDENDKGFEKKQKQRQNKAKQMIAQCNNVKTPGLNQILKTYNAPHGINKNKDLFHSMWNKGQTSLFDERPLHPDFREYCIKDVLDLQHCYQEMIKKKATIGFDLQLGKWVSSQYVKYGYLSTQQGQQKK